MEAPSRLASICLMVGKSLLMGCMGRHGTRGSGECCSLLRLAGGNENESTHSWSTKFSFLNVHRLTVTCLFERQHLCLHQFNYFYIFIGCIHKRDKILIKPVLIEAYYKIVNSKPQLYLEYQIVINFIHQKVN